VARVNPEYLIVYLLLGGVAGVLAGLLGIGGGLIIVPVLAEAFSAQQFEPGQVMHLAIATSLASVVFTAASSALAHHRRGSVRWPVVRQLAPGIVAGALLAGWVSALVSGGVLRVLFGLFAIAAAINLARGGAITGNRELPGRAGVALAGTIIGAISTFVGIGGGTMTVPFLAWCRVDMRTAVGSSAACGMPIAVAGTLALIAAGQGEANLPAQASGFVYWPAALCIALSSVVAAPLGARLAHTLPVRALQSTFAALLVVVGIRLIAGT
jgi:hypothetical protein